MENLKLWESVCKTDPAITKRAKIGGNSITAIDPQFQRKAATEQFGPYGIGWGVTDEEWTYLDIGDTKLCHYTADFWYVLEEKRGTFPINANVKVAYKTQGANSYIKVDDEFAKKVQTNAITKGLSALGFNSDVFEGKFDDNKYVQERKREEATKTEPTIDHRLSAARKGLGEETFLSVLASEEKSVDELPEMTDEYKLKLLGLMNEARLAKKESSK